MRKTKVICTLGPATDRDDVLRKLIINGMNVGRLNFSHGSHEEHLARVVLFKKIRNELGVPAGLLLDTRGPEIRIKRFLNERIELLSGSVFTFTADDVVGTDRIVSVTYKDFPAIVEKGTTILLDDGLLSMKVIGKNGNEVSCEVVDGGPLSDSKKINVPGAARLLPFIDDVDREDIRFGVEHEFEFVAASFVRDSDDVKELRELIRSYGGESIKIISKIEIREGVDAIDEIIRVSDGIMIARGDMGVEIPFEELPSIQKSIIKKCYGAGKPVITETQMLDSMTRNPRPTRAEITDVANAIYDGTSAIMLSGETSVGKYPVESLLTMLKIAVKTERDIDYVQRLKNAVVTVSRNVTNAISHATCETAHTLDAASIISVTRSGHSANMVSKFRPACPIIATTANVRVFNQLSLSWGVNPILVEKKESTDEILLQAVEKAVESGMAHDGDLVVITGGMISDMRGTTNMIKVHIVGDILLEGHGGAGGRAGGRAHVMAEDSDLSEFNEGEVLVIAESTDEVLAVIKSAAAIITEEELGESKAVIVGRALGIPVVAGAAGALEIIKSGIAITVDGSTGRVYSGLNKGD
ncbi:MAG: pyruvate kinase [Chrysiogenales bacterium]|nr:MAG: pyruvate kinase [Chrysiogenales bacterium]